MRKIIQRSNFMTNSWSPTDRKTNRQQLSRQHNLFVVTLSSYQNNKIDKEAQAPLYRFH